MNFKALGLRHDGKLYFTIMPDAAQIHDANEYNIYIITFVLQNTYCKTVIGIPINMKILMIIK